MTLAVESSLASSRAPTRGLFEGLRETTAEAHTKLEASLSLLQPPLTKDRFIAALQGFLGFHRIWEPALARCADVQPLLEGRSRLAYLVDDLAALGLNARDIAATKLCNEAAGLTLSPAWAIGSLYVIEGSTLGGQVISRALQGAPWAPAAGLLYFNPYGDRTGAMWRAFKADACAAWEPGSWSEIEAGALATFALLDEWLGTACAGTSP